MPIKYSCVNEGTNLIAEFPKGDFPQFAETLQKVLTTVPPKEYRRKTLEDRPNGLNYNYFTTGEGNIIGCVATSDVRLRTIFLFMEEVEKIVNSPTATISKTKEILANKMAYHNNSANDKIIALNEEISQVTDVMLDNMDKVITRGEKVDNLQSKSVELSDQAMQFQSSSRRLKRALCVRNFKLMLILIVAGIVFILIIVMIACKPNFSNCSENSTAQVSASTNQELLFGSAMIDTTTRTSHSPLSTVSAYPSTGREDPIYTASTGWPNESATTAASTTTSRTLLSHPFSQAISGSAFNFIPIAVMPDSMQFSASHRRFTGEPSSTSEESGRLLFWCDNSGLENPIRTIHRQPLFLPEFSSLGRRGRREQGKSLQAVLANEIAALRSLGLVRVVLFPKPMKKGSEEKEQQQRRSPDLSGGDRAHNINSSASEMVTGVSASLSRRTIRERAVESSGGSVASRIYYYDTTAPEIWNYFLSLTNNMSTRAALRHVINTRSESERDPLSRRGVSGTEPASSLHLVETPWVLRNGEERLLPGTYMMDITESGASVLPTNDETFVFSATHDWAEERPAEGWEDERVNEGWSVEHLHRERAVEGAAEQLEIGEVQLRRLAEAMAVAAHAARNEGEVNEEREREGQGVTSEEQEGRDVAVDEERDDEGQGNMGEESTEDEDEESTEEGDEDFVEEDESDHNESSTEAASSSNHNEKDEENITEAETASQDVSTWNLFEADTLNDNDHSNSDHHNTIKVGSGHERKTSNGWRETNGNHCGGEYRRGGRCCGGISTYPTKGRSTQYRFGYVFNKETGAYYYELFENIKVAHRLNRTENKESKYRVELPDKIKNVNLQLLKQPFYVFKKYKDNLDVESDGEFASFANIDGTSQESFLVDGNNHTVKGGLSLREELMGNEDDDDQGMKEEDHYKIIEDRNEKKNVPHDSLYIPEFCILDSKDSKLYEMQLERSLKQYDNATMPPKATTTKELKTTNSKQHVSKKVHNDNMDVNSINVHHSGVEHIKKDSCNVDMSGSEMRFDRFFTLKMRANVALAQAVRDWQKKSVGIDGIVTLLEQMNCPRPFFSSDFFSNSEMMGTKGKQVNGHAKHDASSRKEHAVHGKNKKIEDEFGDKDGISTPSISEFQDDEIIGKKFQGFSGRNLELLKYEYNALKANPEAQARLLYDFYGSAIMKNSIDEILAIKRKGGGHMDNAHSHNTCSGVHDISYIAGDLCSGRFENPLSLSVNEWRVVVDTASTFIGRGNPSSYFYVPLTYNSNNGTALTEEEREAQCGHEDEGNEASPDNSALLLMARNYLAQNGFADTVSVLDKENCNKTQKGGITTVTAADGVISGTANNAAAEVSSPQNNQYEVIKDLKQVLLLLRKLLTEESDNDFISECMVSHEVMHDGYCSSPESLIAFCSSRNAPLLSTLQLRLWLLAVVQSLMVGKPLAWRKSSFIVNKEDDFGVSLNLLHTVIAPLMTRLWGAEEEEGVHSTTSTDSHDIIDGLKMYCLLRALLPYLAEIEESSERKMENCSRGTYRDKSEEVSILSEENYFSKPEGHRFWRSNNFSSGSAVATSRNNFHSLSRTNTEQMPSKLTALSGSEGFRSLMKVLRDRLYVQCEFSLRHYITRRWCISNHLLRDGCVKRSRSSLLVGKGDEGIEREGGIPPEDVSLLEMTYIWWKYELARLSEGEDCVSS